MPSPSVSPCSANILAWATRDDLRPGLRSFAVGQYVIVYAVEDEDVEILHVLHGRQDIEGQLGH